MTATAKTWCALMGAVKESDATPTNTKEIPASNPPAAARNEAVATIEVHHDATQLVATHRHVANRTLLRCKLRRQEFPTTTPPERAAMPCNSSSSSKSPVFERTVTNNHSSETIASVSFAVLNPASANRPVAFVKRSKSLTSAVT
mmetsp:Transcript_52612/g.161943  ORF Transcript_52612/g.161943 Transcript_52612/m.161943 type:complete len:145 (-) Transcript_52612:758-1192(-)